MRQEAAAYLSTLAFGLWGFPDRVLGHEHISLKGLHMLLNTLSSFQQEDQSRQAIPSSCMKWKFTGKHVVWLFRSGLLRPQEGQVPWFFTLPGSCGAIHEIRGGMINNTRKSTWEEPWRQANPLEALPMQRELYREKEGLKPNSQIRPLGSTSESKWSRMAK